MFERFAKTSNGYQMQIILKGTILAYSNGNLRLLTELWVQINE